MHDQYYKKTQNLRNTTLPALPVKAGTVQRVERNNDLWFRLCRASPEELIEQARRRKERDFITRSLPPCPSELPDGGSDPNVIKKTYTIDVITPLFGGGYDAGKVDPDMPIRPSSIRGHLRFWWRATRGAKFDTVEELRQREGEIWGSMENPSPVVIEVQQPEGSLGERSPPNYGFSNIEPEAYVLFSAKESKVPLLKEGFQFSLTKSWPNKERLQEIRDRENAELERLNKPPKAKIIEDISSDVEVALQAWVNFGGVGARTRRGCGALYCKELALESIKGQNEYPFQIHYKHISDNNPLSAWRASIESIKKFRQSFRGERHEKKIRVRNISKTFCPPGRSYWPEPDSIRELTGCALKPPNINNFDHSRPLTPTEYFPRAELGLPIVFHFADGQKGRNPISSNLDPPDTMLIPTKDDGKDGARMASPIITRPLKLHNGDCYAIVVALQTHVVLPPLRLLGIHASIHYDISQKQVKNSKLSKYSRSPLSSPGHGKPARSDAGSALEGYLAYIKEQEQGFEEVPR